MNAAFLQDFVSFLTRRFRFAAQENDRHLVVWSKSAGDLVLMRLGPTHLIVSIANVLVMLGVFPRPTNHSMEHTKPAMLG